MSVYKPEDERKPFDVRDYLDRPEVIESYIGDLQVEIERLHAVFDQIDNLVSSIVTLNDESPSKE